MSREYPLEERPFLPPARRSPARAILLIGAGVLLLASNAGFLPDHGWWVLGRLWPLLLIVLGVDLMIGRRTNAGARLSASLATTTVVGLGLLMWIAPFLPGVATLADPDRDMRTEVHSEALGEIRRATVVINAPSGTNRISATEDRETLVEADTHHRGETELNVERDGSEADIEISQDSSWSCFFCPSSAPSRWDLAFSPAVDLDLMIDAGSGMHEFDLHALSLSRLTLDAGSGPTDLRLPAGSYEVEVDAGSGPLSIVLPDGVGVQLMLDSGSGPFSPGEGLTQVEGDEDDSTWETPGFEDAAEQIVITLDQGSGPVTLSQGE